MIDAFLIWGASFFVVHTLWCALSGAKRNGTAVALGVCGQKLSDETVAKVNSLTILLARLS